MQNTERESTGSKSAKEDAAKASSKRVDEVRWLVLKRVSVIQVKDINNLVKFWKTK